MTNILTKPNQKILAQYAASNVLLAFDFDGTLCPIVGNKDDARMPATTRRRLARVGQRYPMAVISGRSKADVESRLEGLDFFAVVGNHGLEPSPDMARYAEQVRRWLPVLSEGLAGFEGIEIEDKVYSVAVHYRRARSLLDASIEIYRVASVLEDARRIPGKKVMNIVPKDAPDKGVALGRLRAESGMETAIYLGDDITDEAVFALDEPGKLLSIRIGQTKETRAPYYLRFQPGIDEFLERLLALRPKALPPKSGV